MKKAAGNVPYLGIIKKAWNITWHNKYLWWFGFFVALGSCGNINYSLDRPGNPKLEKSIEQIQQFLTNHSYLIIIAVVLVLIVLILRIIGKGALISSTYKTAKNRSSDFKLGFREGKKYFWKLLGLGLVVAGYFLAALIILAVPVIFLFVNGNYIIGSLLAAVAIFIFLPLVIILLFLREYGSLYIVLGGLKITAALENSYVLLRRNILSSVIMALVFIPLSIGFFLLLIAVILPVAAVFLIIGLIFYFFISKIGAFVILFLAISVLVFMLMFFRSIWEVFAQTIWVLFFQEIASLKPTEEIEEKVEETDKKEEAFPEPNPVKTIGIEK